MTPRTTVPVIVTVLLVSASAGARTQSMEQRTVDAQLAAPQLDSSAIVTAIDLKATPLGDVVAAIAKAGGITVRYHSAVTNLDALSDVKLSNAAAGDALQMVLASKALTFKATGARAAFIYPNTPENREKYTESVRTFAIVNANLGALMTTVNRAITVGADDLRPVVVTIPSSRTIAVRATPDMMARIAKVIADNDKQSGGS